MSLAIPAVILASASPRRARLMREAGIAFEQQPSAIDESAIVAEGHVEFAVKAALGKARAVAKAVQPGRIVVGCDTIVCFDEERMGKPVDREDARSMLSRLQRRAHQVMSGLAVICAGDREIADCVSTDVWFGAIPDDDLKDYLATPEPYDKAGAYAIQGWAGQYIERIDGDYFNVVGLPMKRLVEMLGEFMDVGGVVLPKAPRREF
jgi:septum formation protein